MYINVHVHVHVKLRHVTRADLDALQAVAVATAQHRPASAERVLTDRAEVGVTSGLLARLRFAQVRQVHQLT